MDATPAPPAEKPCSRCAQTKPIEAFGVNNSRPDGRQTWCRECHRLYERERRAKRGPK